MRIALPILLCLLGLHVQAQQDSSVYPGPCGFGKMSHLHGFVHGQQGQYKKDETLADDDSYMIIPVVVHIIHNGGPENIPDKAVYDQLEVLNNDYGRIGAGYNNNPLGADTKIRFCLASVDPQGNPTTGIVRVQSPYTRLESNSELNTKNLSRWDPKRYLNIWVVKTIDGGSSVSGYAYLAEDINDSNRDIDGVVIDYAFFGHDESFFPPSNTKYRMGRSATHEVGHYFNLLHTWGGDDAGQGGCGDDDLVFDTPDCDGPYYSSFLPLYDSCETPFQCGHYRLIEDYMDYSSDTCMNIFTQGQKVRMRQAILKYRPELVSYANLLSTGCQTTYRQLNPAKENSLTLSPNPSHGIVNIFPYFVDRMPIDVSIYDELGRLVYHGISPELRYERYTLDLTNLRSGMYFFILKAGDTTYKNKVILNKQ